jgi:hypothetical protein
MFGLFVVIGLGFAPLAGLVALLMTLNEWQRHGLRGWALWREPLLRGVAAFLFFFLLSIALGYVLRLAVG